MSTSMSRTDREATVDLDVFERRFLAHANSQLAGRDEDSLADLARETLAFGLVRAPDETLLRIVDLDADATGVDIVTADAPYLVDSVRAELIRSGFPPERILHPQLVVTRDADGRLVRVHDVDDNAAVPDGASVESWTHVE